MMTLIRIKQEMKMTMTDWLAIIGAITGCLALIWDIFKWAYAGAKIKLTVATNMITYGGLNEVSNGKKLVSVEAVNRGDKQTTITHLVMVHYESWWKANLRRKPKANMIVPDPGVSKLPSLIGVGERWVGLITQSKDLEKLANHGYLYVGIYCSTTSRLIRKRLRINSSE